jgi:peroxiredoxin family protein
MDVLFIVRDALASSLVGTLQTAIQARTAGATVAVLVTQEALAALAAGTFAWPRELTGQAMRWGMADRAARVVPGGIPVAGRGDARQLDAPALVSAARADGVTLYACPTWSALLGLEGAPPAGLEPLDGPALVQLIRDAGQVVGSL